MALRPPKKCWIVLASLALAYLHLQSIVCAQEPIPAGPEAYTAKKLAADLLKYELRLVDAYQKQTADPAKVQDAACEIITIDCKCEQGLLSREDRAKSFEIGKKLIEQGSEDPLVYMVTATAAHFAKRPWQETIHYFKLSEKAITQSNYSDYETAVVWVRNRVYHDAIRRTIRRGNPRPGLISPVHVQNAMVKWISKEVKNEADQRPFWVTANKLMRFPSPWLADAFVGLPWDPVLKSLEEQGLNETWLYHLQKGKTLFHEGYNLISYGRDRDIADEKLKQASTHLVAAWKLNPKIPDVTDDLITLARDKYAEKSPRFWFDQTVATQLDFQPAYTKYRTAIRPNHGGSEQKMLEFGWECALTKRYDTAVPFELMECLHAIEGIAGVDAQIWRRQGVFDAVNILCEGSLTSPVFAGKPQSEASRTWLRATQLAIAVRAQRHEDVVSLWDKANPQQLQRAFKMYHVSTTPPVARALSEAVAEIGPDLYDVQDELEQVTDLRTAQSAQRSLTAAIQDYEIDNLDWCIYWKTALEQTVRYYDGEWVEVTFFPKLPQLLGVEQWTVEDKETLACTGPVALQLPWLARLNSPMELTIDIETKEMPAEAEISGILLGQELSNYNRPRGRLFGVNSKTGLAGAPRGGEPNFFQTSLGEVNHVHVRAWRGYWDLIVNDQRIAERRDTSFSPDGEFAIWTPAVAGTKVVTRFSKLRIRQIPSDPPPEAKDYAARVLYYTDRIDEDEQNYLPYFDRAEACMSMGNIRQAKKDYQKANALRPKWALGRMKLGTLQAAEGNYQEALDIYQAILKENPEMHATRDQLAWLQATAKDEKFRDLRAAGQNAKIVVEKDPRNQNYWTTQIAIYVIAKEYSNAEDLMKRRMKFHNGQQEELLQQLQKAIDTKAEFPPTDE